MQDLVERANGMENQLISWRRHLHEHPECSFKEEKTAQFVADVLKSIPGMEVETGIGGYGVVGKLTAGSGKTIALRADMDALPIEETTGATYASKNRGVMHACGHDAHTAILLGAATLLGEEFQAGSFSGTVVFLFQPAEEAMDQFGKTGATYMIEAGALAEVDMAFALHVCPWLKRDAIQLHAGPSMASFDVFKGKITGTGGHGAYPHLGVDPVWLVSHVLPVLYSLSGRLSSPIEPAVVSIGKIQGGDANNVIPTIVNVEGTIRCYNENVRSLLNTEVKRAFEMANVYGGEGSCFIERGEPALVNNEEAVATIRLAAEQCYAGDAIIDEPYGLGSEDFAHMARSTKAAMFFLGCQPEDGQYDLHTPAFQIDERCLVKGSALMAATCLCALRKKEGNK